MTRHPRPAPEQASLLDPPLEVVEGAPELWRSVTAEEERLLARIFPREGCTLPVGKEVYGALVRIGMKKKHRPLRPSDWFEASRAELVQELKAHCQERQLGSYLKPLREGGLLDRRRRRQGPNLWRLPQYRRPVKTGNQLPINGSRPATNCRSTDQGRQPIADPSESKAEENNSGENSARTRKVVPFPPFPKRRQSSAAPDFNVGVRR